jgi:hypothetical protein
MLFSRHPERLHDRPVNVDGGISFLISVAEANENSGSKRLLPI